MSNQMPIDRRQLLRGAGAAALAALLSACRLGPSTSLPERGEGTAFLPTRTVTPPPGTASPTTTSTSTATPTPTPTTDLFGSPLESPLQQPGASPPATTPSATAQPTPTPTPPPTPFPAGPPTKLGLFVAWYHPQIMDLVSTGNVAILKTLELDPAFLREVKQRSPQTIVVGRVILGQLNLSEADAGRAQAEARRAVEGVRPAALDERRRGLVDAWEGYNEPVPGSEDEMRRLADIEAERVRLLAQDGLRAVVGNFGTGQPPLEWWPAFRPALEAAREHDGYLGLHEYSAPTMWYHSDAPPLHFDGDPGHEGWLTLRYRKVYRQYLEPWGLRLPLLITECGVDGLVNDRPGPLGRGWQDFAAYWAELGMGWDTAGNYVEQLAWYDRELQLDEYVLGAAVFAITVFQEWNSYELLGDAATILQQYLSVHPPH